MGRSTETLREILKSANTLTQTTFSSTSNPNTSKDLNSQLSNHFREDIDSESSTKSIKTINLIFNRLYHFQSQHSSKHIQYFNHHEWQLISVVIDDTTTTHHQAPVFRLSYLARFDQLRNLQSALQQIICLCSLRCLDLIDQELRKLCHESIQPTNDLVPILGSKDSQIILGLANMLANWGIYQSLARAGNPLAVTTDQTKLDVLDGTEESSKAWFLSLIDQLVTVVLPDPTGPLGTSERKQMDHESDSRIARALNPRYSLQIILLPPLFVPLVAGLIKLKLDHTQQKSTWAHRRLEDLLNLADPRKVFSCLLSLSSPPSIKSVPSRSAIAFRAGVSQILSARLRRPAGVRGFLHCVMQDDYEEEEHLNDGGHEAIRDSSNVNSPTSHSTSATLNRLNSISRILCSCPQGAKPDEYMVYIVHELLQIIAPDFLAHRSTLSSNELSDASARPSDLKKNHPRPNGVIKAACYTLSRIISEQPGFYKKHLSPLIHSALIPFQASRLSSSTQALRCVEPVPEDGDLDPVVVKAWEISQSICLLTTLVSNSNPSDVLISALVLPILPQLLSLWLFLRQTRSEPQLREEISGLISVWAKLSVVDQVTDVIRRCIRELELGKELNLIPAGKGAWRYWSRDAEGQACIRITREIEGTCLSEDLSTIRPDPDGVADWLAGLRHDKLNSKLLVKWLDELEILRHKDALTEAKMTLFRMQMVLKMIEKLDSSVVQEPIQILEFVKHSFSSLSDLESQDHSPTTTSSTSTGSGQADGHIKLPGSLKFLETISQSPGQPEVKHDDNDEGEEADNSLILTGLTLLLTVLEANPDLDERTAPSLQDISERLDYIILRCPNVRPEVNELSLKCRIMLSVRNALAQVDQLDDARQAPYSDSAPRKLRHELLSAYEEGLNLVADPCLPIRAQGIVVLKKILYTHAHQPDQAELMSSLAPKVVDVLLKLIEEEDSFIYLNAIKALSELAERFSLLICVKLNQLYGIDQRQELQTKGTIASPAVEDDQQACRELDKRLRIGEAMVQIVQRAGQALPIYLKHLLPSLLFVLSSKEFLTCLRWSALTILSSCVEASMGSMLPYISDLIETCLMILSLESDKQSISQEKDEEDETEASSAEKKLKSEETKLPTSKLSGHPALRRSAVRFLWISLSSDQHGRLKREYLQKTLRVLKYVNLVDADALVRYQAGEVIDNFENL